MTHEKDKLRLAIYEGLSERHHVPEIPHITNLLSDLMDKFGGVAGFLDSWHQQLEIAKEKHAGRKFILDHHRDIAKLAARANELEASRLDIESMDESETREFLANLVIDHLAKKNGHLRLHDVVEPSAMPEAAPVDALTDEAVDRADRYVPVEKTLGPP